MYQEEKKMYQDHGMNVKEARQAPLESALKELHQALVSAEEQSSNLESKLKRIMVRSEVLTERFRGDTSRDDRPTTSMLPERPRSEMTTEIQQLALRLGALADRLQHVYQSVDC